MPLANHLSGLSVDSQTSIQKWSAQLRREPPSRRTLRSVLEWHPDFQVELFTSGDPKDLL